MPRRDGTGPDGKGARSGRGRGRCGSGQGRRGGGNTDLWDALDLIKDQIKALEKLITKK